MPITQADLDEAMTRREAAELLHVSVSTIDRMIVARELPIIRIGSGRGVVRITRTALLDHVNRKSA